MNGHKPVYFYSMLTAIMAWSCAANSARIPPWTADIEASFPNRDFIAQKGYGSDKKNAEMDALSAISRYFSMSITTSAQETVRVTDQGSTSTIDSETFVRSQTKLFAVQYTTPWYNKTASQWEAVAYINRAGAWEIFEPNLRQKANAFDAMVDKAENQQEPFRKIILYTAASELAVKEELLASFYFADVLYPLGASFFDDTRALLSALPAKIRDEKTPLTIYVECEGDFDGSVYTAVTAVFSNAGFPITREKSKAAYTSLVTVKENVQTLSAGTFYFPAITVTVAGKAGVVASYSKSLERVGASDAAVAKRRAYTAIANEIQKSFFDTLKEG